jgi:carboxymethylenebutenolidase
LPFAAAGFYNAGQGGGVAGSSEPGSPSRQSERPPAVFEAVSRLIRRATFIRPAFPANLQGENSMGKMVQLTASDGHKFGAYRADPSGKPRGAIVVIQEIFGANHHIKAVADGYAKDGYVAIAPALFDRVSPNMELGYGPEDQEKGRNTRQQLKWDQVLADVQASHDAVADAGKVGVVGYCFGGSVAWLAATRLNGFSASVSYYGGNVADFANEKPKCPVICHIGAEDKSINAEKVAIIKQAQPNMPVYVYEKSGHGFNCDERGSYNEAAAKTARERSLEFLRKHIG